MDRDTHYGYFEDKMVFIVSFNFVIFCREMDKIQKLEKLFTIDKISNIPKIKENQNWASI